MTFDDFYGSRETVRALRSALHAGRLSQTCLITGPAGCGKLTLARLIAASLLCADAADRGGEACGRCAACRKVFADIHPDVRLLDRGDGDILVDDARAVKGDVWLAPNEAPAKVYIVRHAQNMNEAAQNALLKVLEEPPAHVFFLLLCESPDALLPTVHSRCLRLALSPLSDAQMSALLQKKFPDADAKAVAAAVSAGGGVAGRALVALSGAQAAGGGRNAEEWNYGGDLTSLIDALCRNDELALVSWALGAEKWKRQEFSDFTTELLSVLRDALALREGGRPLAVREDGRELARRAAETLTLGQMAALTEIVLRKRALCDGNVGVPHLLGALAAEYSLASGA